MITKIKINGFKSFCDFEMEFTPFTVLAGVNASGKSNLFDALTLLSHIAEKNLKEAFRAGQRGDFMELFTQYDNGRNADQMEFDVEMLVPKKITDAWGATADLTYTRLRYELKITRIENEFGMEDLHVIHERLSAPEVLYIDTDRATSTITVSQDGIGGTKRTFPPGKASQTVLSSFNTVDFKHILAAKEEMKNWHFLQFNSEDLRKPSDKRSGEDKISSTGSGLAAALFRMKQADSYVLEEISMKLMQFIPEFVRVDVVDDNENKQFTLQLTGTDGKTYTSRVLSEGTLRILALCIMEFDDQHIGLLCFEEPENGIHPFRIKDMAGLLRELSTAFTDDEVNSPLRQVIVNTHSPGLVGDIYRWRQDPVVSIWYMQMRNRITTIDNTRMKLSVSYAVPVIKELESQSSFLPSFTEQELKYTLGVIRKYLETGP